MEINVNRDTARAIHINFTLSFIFHIHANTLKLNQVNVENNVNITQYDNSTHEKANFFHNNIYHVSFQSGIKKLMSSNIAITRYV